METLTSIDKPVPACEQLLTWDTHGNAHRPTAHQIIDGEHHLVGIDIDAHARELAKALVETIRREPSLLTALASHAGSTTPTTERPVAKTVDRIVAGWRLAGETTILLDPGQAEDLAEDIDAASVEPETCLRSTCSMLAVRDGLCGDHRDMVR